MSTRIDGLVSAIIPVHNRATMIAEAVASVLAQDYRPIEIIVVDDGSTDETPQALARLADSNADMRILSRDNGGPGAAKETGRLAARGAYLQYLDSDDLLLPGKFSAQVAALEAETDCAIAYGMTRFRHADGALAPGAWKGSGDRVDALFPSVLVSRWWDTGNPLYRREICDEAGAWTSLRIEEDWEYDCRLASLGARLAYVPQFVCEIRDHDAERLSRHGLRPDSLKDRASAQARIFDHARNAGVANEAPEMRHFARALFLLARQCGGAGLDHEAETLFSLARRASTNERASGMDFRLFSLATKFIGWRRAAALATMFERLRQ